MLNFWTKLKATDHQMAFWSVVFFLIAGGAAVLGFTNLISVTSEQSTMAKIIFVLFITLATLFLFIGAKIKN